MQLGLWAHVPISIQRNTTLVYGQHEGMIKAMQMYLYPIKSQLIPLDGGRSTVSMHGRSRVTMMVRTEGSVIVDFEYRVLFANVFVVFAAIKAVVVIVLFEVGYIIPCRY